MVAEEPPDLDKEVPYELVPGVYANLLDVWHTPYEFTLDFGVLEPPEESAFRVVTRVRVPVTLIFEMLTRINRSMTVYERRHGSIVEPTQRLEDA